MELWHTKTVEQTRDALQSTEQGLSAEQPVLVAGPTASGKSALALEIVAAQGGVIVNADALQVYDCWRVLTARPSVAEEAVAPHRLYGHVGRAAPYSVGHWLREVAGLLDQGQVKAAGSMEGLRRMLARRFELRFLDPLAAEQEAALAELGTVLEGRNGLYDLEFAAAEPVAAFRWAQAHGTVLVQLTPRHDRLDEVLIRALHGTPGGN